MLEQYEQLAISSFNNISFNPEKRGKQTIAFHSERLQSDLEELEKQSGSTGKYKEKYISRLLDWLHKQGRCASWFITGPANFPIERNKKALRSVDKSADELEQWRSKYFKAVYRQPTLTPEEEIDEALAELDKAIAAHEEKKMIIAILRKKITKPEKIDLMVNLGISQEIANKIYTEGVSLNLSSSRNRVKRLQERLLVNRNRIEARNNFERINFEGSYIDIEDNRVIICHDQKPGREVINRLKRRGFHYSRRFNRWSRKHTRQAILDAEWVIGGQS